MALNKYEDYWNQMSQNSAQGAGTLSGLGVGLTPNANAGGLGQLGQLGQAGQMGLGMAPLQFNYGQAGQMGGLQHAGTMANAIPPKPPGQEGTDFWSKMSSMGQLAGAGVNAFLGYKNYKLSKKQFQHNKGLSLTNLHNKARTTNMEMSDRQNRRLASQGRYSQGEVNRRVKKYMSENGVRGNI